MKTVRKFILAALCVMLLIVCAVTANAAESGTCGANLTWTLDGDILTISGTGAMAQFDEKPWAGHENEIVHVVIEDGVTTISPDAFWQCRELLTVSLPESITKIGGYAFSSCNKLNQINIPSGITEIGNSAFSYCRALESFTFPALLEQINSKVLYECTALKSVTFAGNAVTYIDSAAFQKCSALQVIALPEGLEEVDLNAFADCTELRVVGIPLSLTKIDMEAFIRNGNIHHVIYPGTWQQWSAINQGSYMSQLKYQIIHVESSMDVIKVTESCTEAQVACTLCDQVISSAKLSGEHFYEDGICVNCAHVLPWEYEVNRYSETITLTGYTGTEAVVEIPDSINGISVTAIGYAFVNNSVIKELTIPAGVLSIFEDAGSFENCSSLEKITVEEGNPWYSSDENGALYNKKKGVLYLVPNAKTGTFVVPDSVEEIAYLALANCTGLTGVSLGSNVTEIAYASFMNCTGLTWMGIPASVKYIDSSAFDECTNMEYYYVDQANTVYSSWDGVLIEEDSVFAAPQQYRGSWTVPEYVYRIGVNAFYNCAGLTQIQIPDRVVYIGSSAFYNCDGLTQIEIPDSVDHTGSGVFEDCDGLKSVSCFIESIAWGMFADCDALQTVEFGENLKWIDGDAFYECDALREVKIPCGVTEIGDSAFMCCDALEKVYLPDTIETIGWQAFYGSPVKDVYYAGTEDQWAQIDMERVEFTEFDGATIHYNYDIKSLAGDFDGDQQITDADAMYLLRHTLFPGRYPISGNGDFTKDGQITDADAMYLLRHSLFPDRYPLN